MGIGAAGLPVVVVNRQLLSPRLPGGQRARFSRIDAVTDVVVDRLPVVLGPIRGVVLIAVARAQRVGLKNDAGVAQRLIALPHRGLQRQHLGALELNPASTAQARGQGDRPKAHPHEPTHGKANGFEHAAHLTVAAFAQHSAIPTISPRTANLIER